MSLQTIVGLREDASDHGEASGRVRLVARPRVMILDRVAQQHARAVTGIGADQLWAATHAATGASFNGWDFWQYHSKGKRDLTEQYWGMSWLCAAVRL